MCFNRIRRLTAAVLVITALVMACVPAASASGQLPADICAQFGSVEITDTVSWGNPESFWFVLVRTPDRLNRLLLFCPENGAWNLRLQAEPASLPQGEGRVRIVITDQMQDFVNNRTVPGPVLMVLQYGTGPDESSVMRYYAFLPSASGEWELFHAFFLEEQMHLDIGEGAVVFRAAEGGSEAVQSVPVHMERNLARIDLDALPRTPEEARGLLPDP